MSALFIACVISGSFCLAALLDRYAPDTGSSILPTAEESRKRAEGFDLLAEEEP